MVAHNSHGKRINLTAKRKTSRQKEKDSRQKEKPHGKRKRLAAKRINSRQKEKSHGKKKKTRGKKNNSRQSEKPHDKKKKTHWTQAKFLRCREVILILISFAVRSRLFFLPWVFFFCREVFLFAVRLFFLPWVLFFLPWRFLFAVLIPLPWQCGPPYESEASAKRESNTQKLRLQIFKFLGISFVIFIYFDLFLIFLFKIEASESKM